MSPFGGGSQVAIEVESHVVISVGCGCQCTIIGL